MARMGIRGIRLNLTRAGVSDPAAAGKALQTAMERAKALGGATGADGVEQPGFSSVVALVKSGTT
jgi:hypothetical protein